MKPQIWHWIWSLSIGGDAKNLCSLAIEQSKWADVQVLTRSESPGERAKDLQSTGIEITGSIDSKEALERLLAKRIPSFVIMHRNGRHDRIETKVLDALKQKGVRCFEFNTFGNVDESADRLFDGHLFPSRSCLLHYAKRRKVVHDTCGLWSPGYAVDIPEPISESERKQARSAIGVNDDDCFVITRIGRPDLRKWHPLPVLAVERLLKSGKNIQFVVRSAPRQREKWLKERLGRHVTLLDSTSDPKLVRQTFSLSDCVVNYSHIGETFGLALAEAMAMGLPVIVNSTPTMDNAQIELCNDGHSGLVANSVNTLVSAVSVLMMDRSYAQTIGDAARSFIKETFASNLAERRTRSFIKERLKEINEPEISNLIPDASIEPCSDEENRLAYRIDSEWLGEIEQRLASKHACQCLSQELMDKIHLEILALADSLDYANSIGAKEVINTVLRRISQRRFNRG